MSQQSMATPQAQRIGKLKGEILKHVMPQEVIGRVGVSKKKPIPKNRGEQIVFRRWLPKGATANTPNRWNVVPDEHRLSEGETPVADTLIAQDIPTSLIEYGVLYRWSNRVEDLYEDEVPGEMKKMVGSRMGLLLEMIRYGQLKAGTNIYRAGNVAARANIIALISGNMLRNIARGLSANLATKSTQILAPSPNIATEPIEAAFVVVCSTDLEADMRSQLTGFVHVSHYGSRKVMHENEVGSWEQFRFVSSPHLNPYLSAGGTTTANTRLANGVPNATGAEAVDVYPFLVMAEECYGDVMLRGEDSMDAVMFPAKEKTKDDPLGQRGVVGAKTYFNCVRLNEGHLAIGEVACSSL